MTTFKTVWLARLEGGVIYVYEVEEDKALHALRHELIDHLITSRIVKPLVDLVNLLIKSREVEIYKEKGEAC